MWPGLPFSNLNKIFFGYFDPENIFYLVKINIVWGDLIDILAKKEALDVPCCEASSSMRAESRSSLNGWFLPDLARSLSCISTDSANLEASKHRL